MLPTLQIWVSPQNIIEYFSAMVTRNSFSTIHICNEKLKIISEIWQKLSFFKLYISEKNPITKKQPFPHHPWGRLLGAFYFNMVSPVGLIHELWLIELVNTRTQSDPPSPKILVHFYRTEHFENLRTWLGIEPQWARGV